MMFLRKTQPFLLFGALVFPLEWQAAARAEQPISGEKRDVTEEIVVTGSHISRPDLAAVSPVSVITGEAFTKQNAVTVEQLLTTAPQFAAGGNAFSNAPGDGAATLDLRGLGAKRTLILIDGRRAPQYDTMGNVDVNQIPTALIKRVDVLTGGASAVYGSDAVAGVVNVVLDDTFAGLRADASSQVTGQGDGATHNLALTGGLKLGDRGHIVMSGGYTRRNDVLFGSRSWGNRVLDSSTSGPYSGLAAGGSLNATPSIFDIPGAGRQQVSTVGRLTGNLHPYNYNAIQYAQIPLTRYQSMALGDYDLTNDIQSYFRASYAHTRVLTINAPTATAGYQFNISPNNPFLSSAEREAFFDTTANPNLVINPDGASTIGIRRRVTEAGPRDVLHTTETYQLMGGLRGSFLNDFRYDLFGQYGRVKKHEVIYNDLSYFALSQALNAVSGSGGAVCANPSGGCVPLDLFSTTPISAAALKFVLGNAVQDTKTSEIVAGGSVSGDLRFLKSPLADNPAAISIGIEYRREKTATVVNEAYASGDLIFSGQGQNIPGAALPISAYDVREAYIEFKGPLVQDRPFLEALDAEAGFRYSRYSTVGTVYSYKYGGDYSPVEGLRFRGIFQRAVRAPNINELYAPVVGSTGDLFADPCSGRVAAQTQAICIAQGAPASAFRNGVSSVPQPVSGQINIFMGGNPELKAEKTDTFTVGAVINPPKLRALTLSVDYYHIRIGNAIDAASAGAIISQCFAVDQDAASPACSGIKRNPLDGSLGGNRIYGVPQVEQNLAVIKTDGIDISAGYRGGRADGFHYAAVFSGTLTRSFTKQSDPASPANQCAGRFGATCDPTFPLPKWKHVLTVDLGFKGLSLDTRWRMIGKLKEDANTDILVSSIPAVSYFDETVSMTVSEKLDLRAGVQNIANRRPPIIGDTVGTTYINGSTLPILYDVLGRTVFFGVSARY